MTEKRHCFLPETCILLCLLLASFFTHAAEPRRELDAGFLLGQAPLEAPLRTSAYRPVSGEPSANRFEGTLELSIPAGSGRIGKLTDWFDYLDQAELAVSDLPPFRFGFVQDGDALVPLKRGPQASAHPHWEYILEPGKVWDEAGDAGWSRASLPFALQEKNANCTHNGLLSFLFRSDGAISRVAYQVGSETCQYFQANLWGILEASYAPGKTGGSDEIRKQYRAEVSARLPVKPISEIALDYPPANPGNFDWFPSEEVSTFGFAINGVHYSGGCQTRYGPYPYCSVLDLPSYSLAKSIFAGMAYMVLEQEFPGAGDALVTDFVPECSDPGMWRDVTLQHLLDMSTGNFTSLDPDVDEFASYQTNFMAGETHALKIGTSCKLFPRKAEPGTTFAYHSSDTYIAGTLMNGFLESKRVSENAGDIHSGILVERVMKPLGLSPVTWYTRRTYDTRAQPFAGYGLTLHPDDIARIGLFLARGDGIIGEQQVLDSEELRAALQRSPGDPGLNAGSETLRYNNGFWAYRTDLNGACEQPLWIPFMSGYGGISIALLPNQSVFYVFSDHGRFEWLKAAIEANLISNYCGK